MHTPLDKILDLKGSVITNDDDIGSDPSSKDLVKDMRSFCKKLLAFFAMRRSVKVANAVS